MPLREYATADGEVFETFFREWPPPAEITLEDGRTARWILSLPARTASLWGDTNQRPHYNRGLRRWVSGDREAEQIAKSRGLVPLRELGTDTEVDSAYESWVSRETSRNQAEGKEQAEYAANIKKFGGDQVRAAEETWSVGRIKAGDTVYAEGGTP